MIIIKISKNINKYNNKIKHIKNNKKDKSNNNKKRNWNIIKMKIIKSLIYKIKKIINWKDNINNYYKKIWIRTINKFELIYFYYLVNHYIKK